MNRGNELNPEKMIAGNAGPSAPRNAHAEVTLQETNLFEGHVFALEPKHLRAVMQEGIASKKYLLEA